MLGQTDRQTDVVPFYRLCCAYGADSASNRIVRRSVNRGRYTVAQSQSSSDPQEIPGQQTASTLVQRNSPIRHVEKHAVPDIRLGSLQDDAAIVNRLGYPAASHYTPALKNIIR